MTVGEFIMVLLAVLIPIILLIRYKVTKEGSFLAYVFERGILKYYFKCFGIMYVIGIILAYSSLFLREINWDFLNYKLW